MPDNDNQRPHVVDGAKRSLYIPLYDPEKSPAPGVPFERRKGPDWLTLATRVTTGLVWALGLIGVMLLSSSAPVESNMFMRILSIAPNPHWDYDRLAIGRLVMAGVLAVSTLGLGLGALRHRRKTDKLGMWHVVWGAIAIGTVLWSTMMLL